MGLRKPLIGGNWKMNKSCGEAINFAKELLNMVYSIKNVDVFIAPTFTALSSVFSILRGSNVGIAAQDVFWEKSGAFTGEISAAMIKDVGCDRVIIGHSERRKFFYETDDVVNQKIKAALGVGICPVFCLGETLIDRSKEKTFSVIDKQIKVGLRDVLLSEPDQIVFAYEPVWAIGTGNAATHQQVHEVHSFIRLCLEELYSFVLADSFRIIYGGSANLSNINDLIKIPDVDGVLVGGSSLKSSIFGELVHLVSSFKLTERG